LTEADVGGEVAVQVSATNYSGTTQATTPPSAPVAASPPVLGNPPVILGTVREGKWIGYGGLTWTKTTTDTTIAVQWKRCQPDGTACQPIPGATSSVYMLAPADAGGRVMVTVTATNPDAAVAANSTPSAVVLPAPPTIRTPPAVQRDPGNVGDVLTAVPGTWSGSVTATVDQFQRCTTACVPIGAPGATSYTITSADIGAIIRVTETASNAGGLTTAWSTTYVGPVRSAVSGSAVLASGAAVIVRNIAGVALASARLSAPTAIAASAPTASARRPVTVRRLTVRRARGLRGALRAWACPVSGVPGARPPACTRAVAVGSSAVLKLSGAAAHGKVRIVVRRGH
jgi:hypothetical protein